MSEEKNKKVKFIITLEGDFTPDNLEYIDKKINKAVNTVIKDFLVDLKQGLKGGLSYKIETEGLEK